MALSPKTRRSLNWPGSYSPSWSKNAGDVCLGERDEMQARGPVRLRDVDAAQALLVNLAKDLAAKGEIMISKNRGDEELVF